MWAALVIVVCMATTTEAACKTVHVEVAKCSATVVATNRAKWLQANRGWKVMRQHCEWGREA